MKKLKLNLDELKVETFETVSQTPANKGTVEGFVSGPAATCDPCSDGVTACGPSCYYTCHPTCGGPTVCEFSCPQGCYRSNKPICTEQSWCV